VLEELHLLGRNPHATKVIRQIRGGLEKTPEGLFLMPTTMPDDIPAGAFKDELINARKIRNGDFRGKVHRPLLPITVRVSADIAKDKTKWQDPANWPMVMPNLGRSVHLNSLIADWETERSKNEQAIRIWASQHLNIEMGVGMATDGWAGAQYWAQAEDAEITLDYILDNCDVVSSRSTAAASTTSTAATCSAGTSDRATGCPGRMHGATSACCSGASRSPRGCRTSRRPAS
jgi:phage terminase large subunit-like protein